MDLIKSKTPFSNPTKATASLIIRGITIINQGIFVFARLHRLWLWTVVCVLGLQLSDAMAASAEQTLQLGVFAYRPKEVMQQRWQPLADYLGKNLPHTRVQLQVLTQEEMQAAIEAQRLDFAFTNPAHYIRLRASNELSGAIATQVSLENGQAVSQLGGAIIRLASRPDLQTLQDLKGRRIASPGTQYLGGYTVQMMELLDHGITPDEVHIEFTGQPHDKVVQAVLKGEVDAGFVRSGVLEQLRKEGTVDTTQLAVVHPQTPKRYPFAVSTRLYPEWAMVALPHVDATTSRRVSSLLLALEPNHPAAMSAGIHGFTIPADYAPVENAMRALHLPPFDRPTPIHWRDVWHAHRVPLLLIGGGAVVTAVLVLMLMARHRRLRLAQQEQLRSHQALQAEKQRLANVIEGTHAGTWELDIATGQAHFNERWAAMLGYTLPELGNPTIHTWESLTHPDDLAVARHALKSHLRGEVDPYDCTIRMRHRDGHWVWVHNRGRVLSRDAQGQARLMSGTHHDVTQRKQVEEQLRMAATVFKHSYDGIIITDAQNRIVAVNPSFERVTGYSEAECLGRSPALLSSGRHNGAFYQALWETLTRSGHWEGDIWNRRKNGEVYPERLSLSVIRDDQGQVTHHLGVFADITAQKAHEASLAHIAHYDTLTGIPNRRLLTDRMVQAMAQARRSEESMAICMLDLDGFKPVNDTYGHEAGDLLLVEIAKRLSKTLRTEDTVARLGGDEFVLIFRNVHSETVFERVLQAVRAPIDLGPHQVTVSGSLGVAYYHPDTSDGEQLLREADQAMYQAKRLGRNRFVVFQPALTQPG